MADEIKFRERGRGDLGLFEFACFECLAEFEYTDLSLVVQ